VLCFAFKESHMPTYTRHHEVIGGSTQAALNHRRSHRPSRLNHQKRDEGIGICSDALVERELRAGTLVRAFDLKLPGYAYYMIRPSTHPREKTINAFSKWLLA
jgi:DNA-binding transcriptional LysR family regulator